MQGWRKSMEDAHIANTSLEDGCSLFGVFDGHGGHGCAEFLRDNLHNIIANQSIFPSNPEKALFQGFKEAEDTFMR